MKTRPCARLAIVLCALTLAGPASALQGPVRARAQQGAPRRQQGPPERGDLDEARRRWRSLSEEEREHLRRRYEEFKELDPAARAELVRRAERLRAQEESVLARLTPELRRKLAGLSPERRREVIEELVRLELERRGGRIREKLPPGWIERLEAADPLERPRLMRQLQEQMRTQGLGRGIEHLADSLGLAREELMELERLPPDERRRAFGELRRREIETAVERRSLPPGVSDEDWTSWRELPTREFLERWHERAPRRGFGPGRAGGPGGPGGAPPGRRGPDGYPGPGGRRAPPPFDPETAAALREALEPDPAWRSEWTGLTPEGQRAKLEARIRERVVAVLASRAGLEPTELERLRGLRSDELRDALRRWLRPAGGRGPGAREGPDGRNGEGRRARRGPGGSSPGAPAERAVTPLDASQAMSLRDALRPEPEWIVELGHLPRAERRAEIEARCHERALAELEHTGAVDAAELERLRRLDGRALRAALHRLARG